MGQRTGIDLLRDYDKGQQLRAADVNMMIAFMRGSHWPGLNEPMENAIQNVGEIGKNTSGSTADRGAVVKPDTASSSIDGKKGWEFIKPTMGMPQAKLVLDIDRTVPDDGTVHCKWAWKGAWCLYTGTDPVLFERWGVTDDSWSLTKGMSGDFLALGSKLEIDSNKFGLFVQILNAPVIAVTNASLAHGSSCEVDQLSWDAGWARTGNTFDAYDAFLNTGESLDEGTIVRVQDYGSGVAAVDAMYCVANDWL